MRQTERLEAIVSELSEVIRERRGQAQVRPADRKIAMIAPILYVHDESEEGGC